MLQKIRTDKNLLITLILTALATYGLGCLANLATGNVLFTQSIFSVPIAIGLFALLLPTVKNLLPLPAASAQEKKAKCRKLIFSVAFSWFLGITLICGYQIRNLGLTSGGFSGKLAILAQGFCLGIAILPFIFQLFRLADSAPVRNGRDTSAIERIANRKLFLLSWLIIFICWIPVFLAYYPAVMSYDFNTQSIQVVTETYHTHHPLVHTGLLWVFFQIGTLLGSYSLGMAFFALVQMLILSCIYAYSCKIMWQLTQRKLPVIIALLFYGLLPIHSVLSISITKDILFSGFFLLFLLLLIKRTFLLSQNSLLTDLAFVGSGILMLLFRNNAVYAFIPFALFYIIMNRREWVRTLAICCAISIFGMGINYGLQVGMKADTGSIAEMCSVPMQQFARVGNIHGNTLSEEDYACIDWYVYDEYWSRYNPPIADTVKITVSADGIAHWEENLPQTILDWIKIGLHYPNEYLDAFLCLTSGYWFLDDVSYAEVLGSDLESRMGILYTFNASRSSVFKGIETNSLLPGLEKHLEEIVSANKFFEWPVISVLFKPAFYCLIMLFALLVFWYRKEKRQMLLVLLPLLYLFTLLLGPVALVRYAYPFIIYSPVLLSMVFIRYK